MVFVPAGAFQMGDNDDEIMDTTTAKKVHNNPRHTVTTRGFWMYRYPVTVRMYKRFCKETGRSMPDVPSFDKGWKKEDHPMVKVSWDDARAYCAWAGTRLPTEAEWEKAARGTDGRRYPWGDAFNERQAQASTKETWSVSNPVNTSQWGVSDMVGNAWQWCEDWYDPNYPASAPTNDPQGPASGTNRVIRGAAWNQKGAAVFRVACRAFAPPSVADESIGFRPVVAP